MWGIEHDGLEINPMFGLKKPFKEEKRKRVLAEWEIALIWSVLPLMAWQFAMLMRLLILTGQRLREIAGIRWEEIDLARLEWIIPGSRTKNKLDHLVTISPQVERLLVAIQPDPSKRRGLLLTTNGLTPISGFSKSKSEMDELVAKVARDPKWRDRGAVLPWVRHDTRRTLSTMCGEMSATPSAWMTEIGLRRLITFWTRVTGCQLPYLRKRDARAASLDSAAMLIHLLFTLYAQSIWRGIHEPQLAEPETTYATLSKLRSLLAARAGCGCDIGILPQMLGAPQSCGRDAL